MEHLKLAEMTIEQVNPKMHQQGAPCWKLGAHLDDRTSYIEEIQRRDSPGEFLLFKPLRMKANLYLSAPSMSLIREHLKSSVILFGSPFLNLILNLVNPKNSRTSAISFMVRCDWTRSTCNRLNRTNCYLPISSNLFISNVSSPYSLLKRCARSPGLSTI